MRILVISNLYPPYHKSGYEMSCQDMVESLKARQHQVKVLTSNYGIKRTSSDNNIQRELMIDFSDSSDWKDVFFKEFFNQTVFKKMCLAFMPEICLFFDLSYISLSSLSLAEEFGLPSCVYYARNWFATREKDQWYQLWPKGEHGYKILRFLTNRFKLLPPQQIFPATYSIFADGFLKDVATELKIAASDSVVIPMGIDINRFPYKAAEDQKPGSLLCSGQINPDRGIDDVIKALCLLNHKYGHRGLALTIAGDEKSSPDYVAYLQGLADRLGVLKSLKFSGSISNEEMLKLYHSCDILVSPSHLEDSSNRTLLEAMCSGLSIVSVSTNSNAEILNDEANALIFSKGSPISCAEQIQRLLEDYKFREFIRRNARNTVEKKFQLEQSVNSLEQLLKKATGNAKHRVQLKAKKCPPLLDKNDREISFNDLVHQAKRWLAL